MNPLMKEVIHDITKLETTKDIDDKIEELNEKLKYYTDTTDKDSRFGGKFSDWAITYYDSLPGIIDGLKQTLILKLSDQKYSEDEVGVLIKAFHLDLLQGKATKETALFCKRWLKENLYKNKDDE